MRAAYARSIVRTIRRATLSVIVLAIPGIAGAVCTGPPIDFYQVSPTWPPYTYVVSPNGPSSPSLVGSFWALGFGVPGLGAGTDNGSFAPNGGWLNADFGPPAIYGSWSQSNTIDGCIDGKIALGRSAEIMVVEFSDHGTYPDDSNFAVAAVSRYPSLWPQFNFHRGIDTDITLHPLPRPGIASSNQVGPLNLEIGVRGPTAVQIQPGFYSDGSVGVQEVIVGYRVYIAQRITQSPPTVLREDGWTPLSGTVPLGEIATVTYECTGLYGWLAYALVYESGFESRYLSPRTPQINCELCLQGAVDADGDSWPTPMRCGRLDCDDSDPHTHPGASEINDGRDNQCPGDIGFGVIDEISGVFGFDWEGDKQTLFWPQQEGATSYEFARSTDRVFASGCTVYNTTLLFFIDVELPLPRKVFHYLVRPTAPLTGSWGADSAGVERSTVCP